METDEILKNNKLIVEFMGFEPSPVLNSKGKKYDYTLPNSFELIKEVETTIEGEWCKILEDQDCCMIEDLKFHSSWEWLMPVVERIESLRADIEMKSQWNGFINKTIYLTRILFSTYEILPNKEAIVNCEYRFISRTHSSRNKIESVYSSCVEFIKWYNENKTLI